MSTSGWEGVAPNWIRVLHVDAQMAFRWVRSVATAAILLVAAACTTSAPGAEQPSAAATPTAGIQSARSTPAGVRITVHRTGGLAGVDEVVTVEPTGKWTRRGRAGTRDGELSAEQSGQLQALAADPRLTGEANRPAAPTKCRDAFNYTVTVGTTRIAYVDCPADPAQPAATQAIVNLVGQYIG